MLHSREGWESFFADSQRRPEGRQKKGKPLELDHGELKRGSFSEAIKGILDKSRANKNTKGMGRLTTSQLLCNPTQTCKKKPERIAKLVGATTTEVHCSGYFKKKRAAAKARGNNKKVRESAEKK